MSVTRRELIAAVAAAGVASTIRAEEAALNPEAEARIAWILGRYGDRFSDEQKADIRRNIQNMQSGFDAMRAYPLDNAVEPATLFRVYRRAARERAQKS
jgi:hypothetical protein